MIGIFTPTGLVTFLSHYKSRTFGYRWQHIFTKGFGQTGCKKGLAKVSAGNKGVLGDLLSLTWQMFYSIDHS